MTLLAVAVSGRGLVDPSDPVLRADDEALLRGRAAFETVRVYAGRPFRLGAHLERLDSSARAIGLPPVRQDEIEALAYQALDAAASPDAVLRLYWTPGETALALVSEVPDSIDELRARGQALVSLLGVRAEVPWLLPGVKSTSYAVNMAADAEAKRRGADDAVFVDREGVVLEGPTTNIWWRRGGTLYTPSLELGILAGVTRATILELAPAAGYEIAEGTYPLVGLAGAEEAFTSSSVREICPVSSLDGLAIPRGPAAAALQAALREAARL